MLSVLCYDLSLSHTSHASTLLISSTLPLYLFISSLKFFIFMIRHLLFLFFFFFNDPPPTEFSPLPLHDALPISSPLDSGRLVLRGGYGIFYSRPSFVYIGLSIPVPPTYVLGVNPSPPSVAKECRSRWSPYH